MKITIDCQTENKTCDSCQSEFPVIRGSIYDDESPTGLYLVALHGQSPEGMIAHLAISMLDLNDFQAPPQSIALTALPVSDAVGFVIEDWSASPWNQESYLGTMLNRDEALRSPIKDTVFEIGDYLLDNIGELRDYFDGKISSPCQHSTGAGVSWLGRLFGKK